MADHNFLVGFFISIYRLITRAVGNVYVFNDTQTDTEIKPGYSIEERGCPNTDSYRLFFRNQNGVAISPFHDIPLEENGVFNMVVEIPRWTNAKMEISKEEALNPIKQDIKKGKLRFVKNIFPHKGYIWNYGALPQTYEDPDVVTEDTGAKGDSDPIDVCEIGHKIHKRGSVVKVKVLGVMALIDEGETDWKLLAIDITDPLAEELNDIDDVKKLCPGLLKKTYEWFRYYKVPDGKPENNFAFDGEAKDKQYALDVVKETHEQWKKLIQTKCQHDISRLNVTSDDSPYRLKEAEAEVYVQKAAEAGPGEAVGQEVNTWHYVIPRST